ncbi:bax inhibitor related [Cystoisospora suis]|uniref:Bax inhibitor related n=1 Tax=Cystoisospora suis TaxID=483139 RepID=A0A2C6KYE7_9APIC|nr:bax inhibitor related [Cystoisospora suis]
MAPPCLIDRDSVVDTSGGIDESIQRRLHPNFYKHRAGDAAQRGSCLHDLYRSHVDRTSILYPPPYLSSSSSSSSNEPGESTLIQRTGFAWKRSNASTLDLTDGRATGRRHNVPPVPQFRENSRAFFGNVSPQISQPSSVVYKSYPLEPVPPARSFRRHHIISDPVYFDSIAPSGIGRVKREGGNACRVLASHQSNRRSPEVGRMRRRNRSCCSEEMRKRSLSSSSSPSSSSFSCYASYPSSSSFLSLCPRREESESSSCSSRGVVPLPMPYWGKYDVYPPLHASSINRIRPFCQLGFHDSFPLYCDLPCEKKKNKMIGRRDRRDEELLLRPYPSLRNPYSAPSFSPLSSSSSFISDLGFSSPSLDRYEEKRRRAKRLGEGSSRLPESEVSFLCKHHRGRHLHLIDLFSPILPQEENEKGREELRSSLISLQYDEKEANEIHRRPRGCLGVHTPLCHEAHATLRRVDRNEESRPQPSELDEFPQLTRNPTSLWWSHFDQYKKNFSAKREEADRQDDRLRRSRTIDETRDWIFLNGRKGKTRSSEALMNDRQLYFSDRSRLY